MPSAAVAGRRRRDIRAPEPLLTQVGDSTLSLPGDSPLSLAGDSPLSQLNTQTEVNMLLPTPIGTIWSLILQWKSNNQVLLNTFNYRQEVDNLDYVDFAALAQGRILGIGRLVPTILDAVSNTCTLERTLWQPIRPTRLRAARFTLNSPGTQQEVPLPQNVAQVITRSGDPATRRSIGSIHLPPCDADRVENGVLTAPQRVLVDDVAALVRTPLTDELDNIILTPVLIARNAADPPIVVRFASVQNTIRVMRRRTVGVGQ